MVLPHGNLDGDGGERERALIERGMPYLDLIWSDANWRLYAVENPTPIADPPALVRRAEQGAITLDVLRPGRVLVRLPYSPWLGLVDADGSTLRAPEETAASRARTEADPDRPKEYANRHGCLAPTEPDATGATWTELVAPKAGTYRIAAPYEIPRGTACPEELR